MAPLPDNVVQMPARPARLRADVPPFNPADPTHLRAWEAIWDMGQHLLRENKRGSK